MQILLRIAGVFSLHVFIFANKISDDLQVMKTHKNQIIAIH